MNLENFCESYCANTDVSDEYAYQLKMACRYFVADGGAADCSNITAEQFNAHLKRMKAAGAADSYRSSRRKHLMVILRAARRKRHALKFKPAQVMRLRIGDRVTQGWTVDEVRRLLAACDILAGAHKLTGVNRRGWWRSYIMARWDTGLDDPTLRSMEFGWIPPSGQLTIIRHKTGKKVRIGFHPITLAEIAATFPPPRAKLWPLWATKRAMHMEGRKLIIHAGLRGSLKWLRSGSGSNVEAMHPGEGHRHLGNTRAIFERHYEVQEITQQVLPMPEPLV
jgi:hypothetical protein